MKKIFLLLSFILFSITVNLIAQGKANAIGIQFSPLLTSIHVSENTKMEDTGNDFGFSTGVFFEQTFTNNFSIMLGLNYANERYIHHGYGNYTFESDYVFLPDGTWVFQGYSRLDANAHLQFIKIPATVKYYFWKHKLFATFGVAFEVLIKNEQSAFFTTSAGDTFDISPVKFTIRDYNIGTLLSIGYQQPVGKRMAFSIQSTLNASLLKNDFLLTRSKINFTAVGVSFGVAYTLNDNE
jgi:Outer membrane protein beta-barrel domain